MVDKWVRSGPNWMFATWNGDAQLIYLLERDPMLLSQRWAIRKKVAGAARPEGYVIAVMSDLEAAKAHAEHDAELSL